MISPLDQQYRFMHDDFMGPENPSVNPLRCSRVRHRVLELGKSKKEAEQNTEHSTVIDLTSSLLPRDLSHDIMYRHQKDMIKV